MIDPTDPIICQGELQKYKPGFTGTFIDRWVQVTKKAIRYFASKPGSHLAAGKPLMAFPIKAIAAIQKVSYDLPLKGKKAQSLSKNMFEIFLKDDFLDIFLRHDYERLFCPSGVNRASISLKGARERRKSQMNSAKNTPPKKKLKELYIPEDDFENKPDEPLSGFAMQTLNTH